MGISTKNSIWEALAMGEDGIMETADAIGFNWKASHPRFGSVIHAILFGDLTAPEEAKDAQDVPEDGTPLYGNFLGKDSSRRLALLECAIQRGADAHVAAPSACDGMVSFLYGYDDQNEPLFTDYIDFDEKTAIQCVLASKRVVQAADDNGDWKDELSRMLSIINQALSRLFSCNGQSNVTRVPVPESILDIWSKVFADTSSSDVVIHAHRDKTEDKAKDKVHAHSNILRAASPVLCAMLSSEMREGSTRSIVVQDCGLQALKLLLSLLYSGSLPAEEEEPALPTMLDALSLGHRWQVNHVVDVLATKVSHQLTVQHFEAAAEVALRLQLDGLLRSCKSFIIENQNMLRTKLSKKGSLGFQSGTVRAEVERVLSATPSSEDHLRGPCKRRRVF